MIVHVTPTDARRAASLMLLRDGASGLEVLMLRRAERDGDLRSGACVFPGGVLDAADREAHAYVVGIDDAVASARLGLAQGGLDYLVAAARESFEEVGLLLACDAAGRPFNVARHAEALRPWRDRLQQGEASLAALCREFDLRIDLRGVHYVSHWLTPPGVSKRFDTRFFVVPAPAGQVAEADTGEAVELMWTTAAAALDGASGYKLLPVTRRTLQELSVHADAAGAIAHAARPREITVTMPRRGLDRQGRMRIVLPDEHPYEEIARLDPEGRMDARAEIVPGEAVDLSARIRRVTAPNPGVMTGPGTNSYLVREPGGTDWTVIDPGPADEQHMHALLTAARPGRIVRILTTHTHVDHSPGAASLAAATGAERIGRRAPPHSGQDADFAPDREPVHGDRVPLGPTTALRVLHTPGHASNHLCYLLEAEHTLFTGDQVMQGSTVIINPPDGDMAAYLASLHALLDEDLQWLAPGHGFLVARPHALIRALIAHRMRREGLVCDALAALGPCTVEALVPTVYAEVPAARHGIAARSLLAHLLKLRDEGRAVLDGERWSGR